MKMNAEPSCYWHSASKFSLKFIKLPSDTIKAKKFTSRWTKIQWGKVLLKWKLKRKTQTICQQLSYCVAFKEMTKVVAIYASPFMRSPLNVIP